MTKTAVIVPCQEGILIWAIPPLLPQPSDIPDHFLDINPIHIPPLFQIPFPDGIIHHTPIFRWMTLSSWYFGSLDSFYFDIFYTDSRLKRFKAIIKPDLSDASLHIINMTDIFSEDFSGPLETYRHCEGYRICEDTLVHFWSNCETWGAYTALTSAPFTNIITRWIENVESLCPASGRFVYCTDGPGGDDTYIVVADLY